MIKSVNVSTDLKNRKISDIEVTSEIRVASIARGHSAFVPAPTTIIKKNDRLFVSVLQESMGKLERMFGFE